MIRYHNHCSGLLHSTCSLHYIRDTACDKWIWSTSGTVSAARKWTCVAFGNIHCILGYRSQNLLHELNPQLSSSVSKTKCIKQTECSINTRKDFLQKFTPIRKSMDTNKLDGTSDHLLVKEEPMKFFSSWELIKSAFLSSFPFQSHKPFGGCNFT